MNLQLAGLLTACAQADDFDSTPWLVLADWLDERDDPRGTFVRLNHRHAVVGAIEQRAIRAWLREYGHTLRGNVATSMIPRVERGWLQIGRAEYHQLERLQVLEPPQWPTRLTLTIDSPDQWPSLRALIGSAWQTPWVSWTVETDSEYLEPLGDEFASWPLDGLMLPRPVEYTWEHWLWLRGRLPNLRRIHIGAFNGPIRDNWQWLIECTRLRELHLDTINRSDGDSIGQLAPLHILELVGFPLDTGVDFEPWLVGSLRRLSVLCGGMQTMLPHLATLKQLCDLEMLGVPHVRPRAFTAIKRLQHLERLNLDHATIRFVRGHLAPIAQAPNLRELSLAQCLGLTNAALHDLIDCPRLETLNLTGNRRLTDACLPALKQMRSLRLLYLRDCSRISRAGVAQLRDALPECTILMLNEDS